MCQQLIRADEGAALGIAGAVLAVVLAVAGWLVQKGRAGRDVNIAGRDQAIINYRSRDE